MIETLTDLPTGILGLRIGGTLTKHDFEDVITPMVNRAQQEGGRLRCLIEIGPDFSGLTPPALVDDIRLGLHTIGAFEGVAVLSDGSATTVATKWAAFFLPFPTRVFPVAERKAALDWLAALDTGARITAGLDEATGVVTVEVEESLRIEDFEVLASVVDPWMREKGELTGLVVHLRTFPHWASVGSLVRHVRFVLGHVGKIGRVAVVTDTRVAGVMTTAADHLMHPTVRAFAYDDLPAAQAWAAEPG